MKKIFKDLIAVTVTVVAAFALLNGYSAYLTNEIARLYVEKADAVSRVNKGVKETGDAWIRQSAAENDLFVLGSSELSSKWHQHIKYDFPNPYYPHNVSCIGHSYVQNMLHAVTLGADSEYFRGADVIVVESMQWFLPAQTDATGLMANFSELHFYEFLVNPDISDANKEYLCRRFLELEERRSASKINESINAVIEEHPEWGSFEYLDYIRENNSLAVPYDYPQTHLLASLYVSDSVWGQILYTLMRPYYYIRGQFLSLKDKYDTYIYLRDLDGSYQKPEFDADWEAELDNASIEGAEASTNNPFYIYDDYYTEHLEPNLESLNGIYSGMVSIDGDEWDDFRFLLSVCNDLGIDPYIINVSCNGYWYDYTGLSYEVRQQYYRRMDDVASEYGIETYSGLKSFEYEPYVFADFQHLGWRGWIYVAKAVTEHFG